MIFSTLAIYKPGVVYSPTLLSALSAARKKAGLELVASHVITMTEDQAKALYDEHKEKPHFRDLVTYMTSGPVVVSIIGGEDPVPKFRGVVAEIRAKFATSVRENIVHGSDSPEAAARELAIFFPEYA